MRATMLGGQTIASEGGLALLGNLRSAIAAAVIPDLSVVVGDGGVRGVKGSSASIDANGTLSLTGAGSATLGLVSLPSGATTKNQGISFGDPWLHRLTTNTIRLDSAGSAKFEVAEAGTSYVRLWTSSGSGVLSALGGALAFQSGAGPTTALTLGADQSATFAARIYGISGNSGAPMYGFTSAGAYGMYLTDTISIGFTAGSGEIMTIKNSVKVFRNALTATPTDGLVVTNTTTATAAVPVQMSPRVRLNGSAWNSSGAGSNETQDWTISNLPATVAGTTTSTLRFGSSVNGAGYTYPMTVSNTGALSLLNYIDFTSATIGIAGNRALRFGGTSVLYQNSSSLVISSFFGDTLTASNGLFTFSAPISVSAGTFTVPALAITPTDGLLVTNTTNAVITGGLEVQMSPRIRLHGSAYNSISTLSETHDWTFSNLPVTAAGPTSSILRFGNSLNGAGYTYPMTLSNAGSLRTLLDITADGGYNLGSAQKLYWAGRAVIISPAAFKVTISDGASLTTGATLDTTTNGTLAVKDFAGTSAGNLTVGSGTFSGAITTTPTTLTGAGAILTTSGTTVLVSAGTGDALTLADGTNGQIKTIVFKTRTTGTDTMVLTPTTKTGWSTATFVTAGSTLTLQFFTTIGWVILASYTTTIA